MKKRVIAVLLLLSISFTLCSCSTSEVPNSTFSIQFIDVGQGDSALVECDGHYMLIDGGDRNAGYQVYDALKRHDAWHLDILAISHLHMDHYGGLEKALSYTSRIDLTISNANYADTETFMSIEELYISRNGGEITIPEEDTVYELGSATVEVVDVSNKEENDSLVILITYGSTKFLFTGDIEKSAQARITEKFSNDKDEAFKVDLIKMPHHGSYSTSLYTFLRTFMADYVVISVGKGNRYGHPDSKTLSMLESKTWKPKVYRTDYNGNIVVTSDGKNIAVEKER